MLAKLAVIVLALGVTASSLLAVRQQRLQAVSEMATAIERASAMERRAWRVRVEIARRSTPESLVAALEGRGEMEPIIVRWCEVVGLAEAGEAPGHGG